MRDRARLAIKIQHRIDDGAATRLGIGDDILQAAAFRLIKRMHFRMRLNGLMPAIPTERLIGIRAIFFALAAELRFIDPPFTQRTQQSEASRARPAPAMRQGLLALPQQKLEGVNGLPGQRIERIREIDVTHPPCSANAFSC